MSIQGRLDAIESGELPKKIKVLKEIDLENLEIGSILIVVKDIGIEKKGMKCKVNSITLKYGALYCTVLFKNYYYLCRYTNKEIKEHFRMIDYEYSK